MKPFSLSGYGEKGEIYRKIFDVELITSVEDVFFTILENFLKYAPEEFEQVVKEIKQKIIEGSSDKRG